MKGEFVNRNADSFKAYFAGRFLSQIGSGRVLLLGALLIALAVSVGLVLAGPAGEVRAQETVTLHQGEITVSQSDISDDIVGYSDFKGTLEKDFYVETVFGSIDTDSFEYLGTTYTIQRLVLNDARNVLGIKIQPLFSGSATGRPSLTIGEDTYPAEEATLRLDHYFWGGVELDWEVGDSIPFTLSLTHEASPGTETQSSSSADIDFASIFGVTIRASAGGEGASAQETVTLHQGTITVGQSQISDDVVGYSDFTGTVEKDFSVETVFGSIDADSFKYLGTTYKIQRIFLNKRFDALVVKIDPLLNDGTQYGPNVIIGDETYSVEDSMLELEHYSWLYVELDWHDGDTVPFTLSLAPEATTDVGTQSSAGVDFATMFGVAVQAPDIGVRASAQSGMPVHEATITLAQDPDSKYFYGFSDYVGPLHGFEEVESIYGSITDPTFEHEGTGYEIQRLFYNWALNVLYIKIDPLFEGSSNIRPTLTLGDQTYDGEDTFLGIQHYIWWEDIVPLEWEIGDSVPLTLALSTVSSPDTQSSSDPDLVSALNSLTGREGGEGFEEEGGGLSGWMGWVGAVAAVVVASIGYTAYRVLR